MVQGRKSQQWKQEVEFSVKPFKEFAVSYSDKGVLRKGAKVTAVTSKSHSGKYICRKLRMADMPCQNMDQINRHIRVLSSVDHPHLCKLIDAFEDKSNLYLVYERANPMTLFEHIREKSSLTEEEAADYMRQVAMALSVAHSQGIAHGKLSPRSIILAEEDEDEDNDARIKICDMGQAFVLTTAASNLKDSDKTLELQKYAISPELADGEVKDSSDGTTPKGAEKNDIWAIGIIFYHMLSGTTPFKITSRADLMNQMTSKEIKFQDCMWSKLSADARDLIEQTMRLNPGIRIASAAILRHPWVKVAKATFPRIKMVQLLQNMHRNADECQFKRFVLRVIAAQLPRDGRVNETVETAFRCLDKNGDGVLNVDEVIKGLKKHLGLKEQDHELENLFAQLDRDGSGTVNVQEFVSSALDQKRTTSMPVLWQAFNAFDNDRSGHVDFDEIERTVKEIEGASLGIEQVDFMCREIRAELERVGTQGHIDFDQFVYLMQNRHPNVQDTMKKDLYRACWNTCNIDCYKVRHLENPERWDIKKMGKDHYRRPKKRLSTGTARSKDSAH